MSERMNPAIQCEFQVMNWGESATSGAWVKFWLNPEDLDAFRAIQCRSGKNAGQRFMGVLVEIGDDEQPVAYQNATTAAQQAETVAGNTVSSPAGAKPVGGPLARLAGMLCANPKFQEWACGSGVKSGERAAAWVRDICGIESRADLDHNEAAAETFHKDIRLPFLAWQGGAQNGVRFRTDGREVVA